MGSKGERKPRPDPKPFDPITRRVREALYYANGRVMDELPFTRDSKRQGKEQFRRLSGTYGLELRKLATERPELSPEELAAAVVAPAEFPEDLEVAAIALDIISGERDRIRRSRPGDPVDLSIPIPSDISQRIEELRGRVREGIEAQEARPRPEPKPFVRAYSVVPRFVYDALRRPPMD